MKYVLDTDIISYFLKGDMRIVNKLLATDPKSIFTTSINYSELLFGALNAQHNSKKLLNDAVEIPRIMHVIEYNLEAAEIFATLKAGLVKKGQIITDMDLMIAAVAIVNNCTLVTNNEKHFRRIKKLKIANWKK